VTPKWFQCPSAIFPQDRAQSVAPQDCRQYKAGLQGSCMRILEDMDSKHCKVDPVIVSALLARSGLALQPVDPGNLLATSSNWWLQCPPKGCWAVVVSAKWLPAAVARVHWP